MERVRPAFALTTYATCSSSTGYRALTARPRALVRVRRCRIVPPVILGRAEQPFESFADINQSSAPFFFSDLTHRR